MLAIRVPTPTAAERAEMMPMPDWVHVYAEFTQNGESVDPIAGRSSNARDQIVVPAKDAGKQFVLMLTGTARIGQPTGSVSFQSRSTACAAPPGRR